MAGADLPCQTREKHHRTEQPGSRGAAPFLSAGSVGAVVIETQQPYADVRHPPPPPYGNVFSRCCSNIKARADPFELIL